MTQQMHPGTFEIYMRYTGEDGSTHVQSHFVWDAPRFVKARQAEAKAEAKKKGGKNAAEQITKEQYENARK